MDENTTPDSPDAGNQATPAAAPGSAPLSAAALPHLDRPRRPRPDLLPSWMPIAIIVAVSVIVILGGGLLYASTMRRASVPKVVGLELGVAQTRLAQSRLAVQVTERRFSTLPADTVISQSPAAGTSVKQGSNVDVVVSAGSEEFSMPDVIGNGLLLARGVLEAKGLELKIETEPSEQPSDTVLSTNPAAGSLVRTGDVVRVTVAAAGSGSSALLPLNLQGVAVILDPAPVPAKQLDVPLEVARRVRSLIEASGGTVVTTRALADTGTASAAPARAKRAKEGSATLAIGLEVSPTGPRGAVAYYPLSGPQALVASSKNLASQIATSLTDSGIAAQASSTTTDAVLSTRAITWSRVRLGSLTAREDVASFRDPAWADTVARAIYRAIADLYGRKSASP